MNIDKQILKKQSEEIKKRIEDLEKEILEDLNETKATFKLASNDHLGKKLKSLGWPITDYNKNAGNFIDYAQYIKQNWDYAYDIFKTESLKIS